MVVIFAYKDEAQAQEIIALIKEHGFDGTIEKNTPRREIEAQMHISEAEVNLLKIKYTLKNN
jgi:chitinase